MHRRRQCWVSASRAGASLPCALPLLLVFLHLLHIAAACRRYCWPANTLFRLIYWLAAAAGGQRSCHTHTQHTVLQGRDNSNCCIMYVAQGARRGGPVCLSVSGNSNNNNNNSWPALWLTINLSADEAARISRT